MNLRHPFGNHFRVIDAPAVNDRVQRPMGMKWCVRCKADRPSKGGKKVGESMFQCALHRRPAADISALCASLVNPAGEAVQEDLSDGRASSCDLPPALPKRGARE